MKYAVGEVHGNLTIIGINLPQSKRTVRCICGHEKEVSTATFKRGAQRIYGCKCPKVTKQEAGRRYLEKHADKIRERRAQYKAENAEKVKSYAQRYYREKIVPQKGDPEWRRRYGKNRRSYYIRRTYGLSQQQFVELTEKQGNVCAICQKPEPTGTLRVDHDHQHGFVRGLLCHRCNTLLGHAKDSFVVLQRAIEYLGVPL